MGLADGYSSAAWEDYGLQTTWTPEIFLQVGDIVTRDSRSGAISVQGRLGDLVDGLPGPVDVPGAHMVTLQRGVSITAEAEVGAGPASAQITFAGASSFVFIGQGGSTTRYGTLRPVTDAVAGLAAAGKWPTEWRLVTAVRRFETAALAVARGRSVTASVKVPVATTVPSLATVDVSAGIGIRSGDAAQWQLSGRTPFFEELRWEPASPWRRTVVEGDEQASPDFVATDGTGALVLAGPSEQLLPDE